MDNSFLWINSDENWLSAEPQQATLIRAGGEVIPLDLAVAKVQVTEEHPPVDGMEGDWGAVCEVFRKTRYFYLSVRGVSLAAGDSVEVRYSGIPTPVIYQVIEMENGRARISAPVFGPAESE